jgi:arginase family enzyme
MDLVERMAAMLRPPGGGIHLVSTGREAQAALMRALAGVADDAALAAGWRRELARAAGARAVLLGIPSDTGAGFRRGANQAPAAVRQKLLADDPAFFSRARAAGLVDLGDVFTVPQLLHDESLSADQVEACRRALYPAGPAEPPPLPVAPLSIAERVFRDLLAVNPHLRLLTLGGDHSTAWPAVAALASTRRDLGVVQLDAHTDLLPERLGIRICFGTWSFHANELLGRGGRLIQLGIRASGRDQAHWEGTLGVRQLWAEAVRRDPGAALEEVVALARRAGVRALYLSNDVDGLDPAFISGTGTPEPGGLDLDWVLALVRRLGREFELVGGDLMEVAPDLAPNEAERDRSLATAARCLAATVDAVLGSRAPAP